jgi:hypothetical protein
MSIPSTWWTPRVRGWRRSPSHPWFATIFLINSLVASTCSKKKAPLAAASRCSRDVRLSPW